MFFTRTTFITVGEGTIAVSASLIITKSRQRRRAVAYTPLPSFCLYGVILNGVKNLGTKPRLTLSMLFVPCHFEWSET
jgi:hypothetical protein